MSVCFCINRYLKTMLLLAASVLIIPSFSRAELYEANEGFRTLRLNIPEGVDTVRALLVACNWAGGDVLHEATNPEFVRFAARNDLAIVATAYFRNFSEPDDSEMLLFESLLAALANHSGHPEIEHAPWLPLGNSNGGQMSYGLAAKRPERSIGFVVSKGCCYNDPSPSIETLAVPGILIAGEFDTEIRRNNIRNLFLNNRARGALWAWVEEEATGHDDHNGRQLKFAFLAECLRLRYPPDSDLTQGPVSLVPLHEDSGWLVDYTTWDSGFTHIIPYDDSPESLHSYGWVPNQKMAFLYRAFASRQKISSDIDQLPNVYDLSEITYRPKILEDVDWSEIEAFADHHSLGTVVAGEDPTWSVDFQYGGLYTFHAVVTLADGNKRVTYLDRIFADLPTPKTVFENWMYDTSAPGSQFSNYQPEPKSQTLIERFAYGEFGSFKLSRSAEINQATVLLTTQVDLHETGVEVAMERSSDLLNWTTQQFPVPPTKNGAIEHRMLSMDTSEDETAVFVRVVFKPTDSAPNEIDSQAGPTNKK